MSHVQTLSNIGLIIAMGAVALVLFLGLANMLRGGAANTSQRLMRWRVGLQFVAIVIIVLVLLARSHLG